MWWHGRDTREWGTTSWGPTDGARSAPVSCGWGALRPAVGARWGQGACVEWGEWPQIGTDRAGYECEASLLDTQELRLGGMHVRGGKISG
jgi:hypothetical protein